MNHPNSKSPEIQTNLATLTNDNPKCNPVARGILVLNKNKFCPNFALLFSIPVSTEHFKPHQL